MYIRHHHPEPLSVETRLQELHHLHRICIQGLQNEKMPRHFLSTSQLAQPAR